jgi:hypothetical protein
MEQVEAVLRQAAIVGELAAVSWHLRIGPAKSASFCHWSSVRPRPRRKAERGLVVYAGG